MEIELIKKTIIEGVPFEAGALVDVTPQNAEKLIQRGFAFAPQNAKCKTSEKAGPEPKSKKNKGTK
jgi:hypothetical protein